MILISNWEVCSKETDFNYLFVQAVLLSTYFVSGFLWSWVDKCGFSLNNLVGETVNLELNIMVTAMEEKDCGLQERMKEDLS